MRARDWVWDGGRPSLDFVNTYRDRKGEGWELLREPADLLAWLGLPEDLPLDTGTPAPPESTLPSSILEGPAATEPFAGTSETHGSSRSESVTGRASGAGEGGSGGPNGSSAVEGVVAGMALLVEARELREAICRCLDAAMAGERGFPEPINRWAARRQPSLVRLSSDLSVVRLPPRDPVVAALAEIACDAIELIGGPDLRQVRVCASPSCGLRFADRSNAGSRQWCSMKRCGNREKVRLHRARRGEL
ncbi:CGNR zinc finger domain-containing protein [Nonomuraea dietziae]|uniref:CGNR zinc finger domain-containing protein n=1 Tax=Nonomuraea dietziae TaxID=65515 RepID=UPI0033CFE232